MTDRLKGCVVSFEKDIRKDDAEYILNAIKMIKGVNSVETSIANYEDWMNRDRVKFEIRQKIYDIWDNLK